MSLAAASQFAIITPARRLRAVLAAFALLAMTVGDSWSQAELPVAPALSPQQIDQLVAPIALYPDNLLAQVFAASTYPLDVVVAARWSAANPNVKGRELEDAMQGQSWDPSVKALSAVPQVLQMMNDQLEWTKQLGEAYLAQPDDVAAAVQRLRARADASGNLKASNQLNVRRVPAPQPVLIGAAAPPDYIIIEPVQPDIIYVPVYDPWLAYGAWPYPAYRPFYWYPPGYVAAGVLGFGAPLVVGAALWSNYNWYSRRVDVNVVRFNSFNRVTLANTAANQIWQHNPARRGNLSYGNPVLQQKFGKAGGVHGNRPNFGMNQQLSGPTAAAGGKKGTANVAPDVGAKSSLNSTGKHQSFNERGAGGHRSAGKTVNIRQNVDAPKAVNRLHGADARQSFGPKNVGAAQNGNGNQKGRKGPP